MLWTARNPALMRLTRGFLPFLSQGSGEVLGKEVGMRFAIPQPVSQISEAIEKCGANPSLKLFLPPTSTLFSRLSFRFFKFCLVIFSPAWMSLSHITSFCRETSIRINSAGVHEEADSIWIACSSSMRA